MSLYLAVLSSGDMGGTTLIEMRRQWTITDLFDALDHVMYLRAQSYAHSQAK
jgi:hypothetical protein